VKDAAERAAEQFGGIDIVVNNASAINLSGTEELEVKRYDLMQNINVRGTFVVTKASLPYLKRATNPHVLTLSPPLNLDPKWLGAHVGYTISKYNMSMLTLGWAEEFREDGIAFNSLWPRTMIATAAVKNLLGGEEAMAQSRTPEIVADAAYAILTRPSRECTGNFFIDEEVLTKEGVSDLDRYRADPEGSELATDLFLD
jgi:citronellol/citronellal dehydrogenase